MFEKFGLTKKTIVSIALILFFGLILFVSTGFRTTKIEYEGTTRYTDDELTEYIFGGKYNVNTLIYYFFTSKNEKVSIPFVQDYEVSVDWPNKLNITIFEKSIIGYVRYMGYNLYFDKDGVIVDSSKEQLKGIPEVSGLNYSKIVLHEKMDVSNEKVFAALLETVQLCEKYEIDVTKVFFDNSYDMTMYVGNIKILLGDMDSITEKIYEVGQMLPQMQGLSGTLHMENFSDDTSSIIFKKDK